MLVSRVLFLKTSIPHLDCAKSRIGLYLLLVVQQLRQLDW
jgi:hypothetical protein